MALPAIEQTDLLVGEGEQTNFQIYIRDAEWLNKSKCHGHEIN